MTAPVRSTSNMGALVKRTTLLMGTIMLVGACLWPGTTPESGAEIPTATPQPPPPTASPEPTSTSTPIPPSPTPQPPVISAGTVSGLSVFMTFGQGETSRSIAFSPDGTAIASAAGNDTDFAIRVWAIPSGQTLAVLDGHQSIVYGLGFSPDGTMLASASKDHTARIWDWRGGSMLHSLSFFDEVTSVEFSPDSQILAVGGVEDWPYAAIWTYAVGSWQPLRKLAAAWNIPDMAFTSDGQRLVGGGTSRLVHIWRVSDGAELKILHHAGQVSSVAISPNGSRVATGLCVESDPIDAYRCTRGAVWVWDLQSGLLLEQLEDFHDFVEGVAYTPDGSVLLGGSRRGELRAYAAFDYQMLFQSFTPGGILDLAISPDGRLMATGRSNGQIDLWRVEP
jgi:WD40 repeat protein